jgi:multidrug efflux pump subunit AcrB
VAESVRNANILASPGLIDENHHLELALVSGQAREPAELNSIVVSSINGAPVTVADVATVESGAEPQYTIVTADGHPAVLLNVLRQPSANTVAVVDEVKTELDRLRGQLPKDIRIAPFYDQSLLVREGIRSVRDSILVGLLLSVGILFAFLRNWGTTVVAILVIPVTILATFLAMWASASLIHDAGGVMIGPVITMQLWLSKTSYPPCRRAVEARATSAVSEIGSDCWLTITPVVVFCRSHY